MAFKTVESILQPDPRFADLCVVENATARRMTLADHHAALAKVGLTGVAPADVVAAFDRARNTTIYAFFDYDLFVVGEVQAFGAFELALKHRLNGHGGAARGTLRNLVDRASEESWSPACAPARAYRGLRPYRGPDRLAKRTVSRNVGHPLTGNGARGCGCLRLVDRSHISIADLTDTHACRRSGLKAKSAHSIDRPHEGLADSPHSVTPVPGVWRGRRSDWRVEYL